MPFGEEGRSHWLDITRPHGASPGPQACDLAVWCSALAANRAVDLMHTHRSARSLAACWPVLSPSSSRLVRRLWAASKQHTRRLQHRY